MAITSIWSVKGWLGKLAVYVENPDKTENPAYFEKQGMTAKHTQGLSDVIDYAAQTHKTQITDENALVLRHYASGVNCAPETARDEMLAAKKKFGKEDGVVAYHGIQSFSPEDLQTGLTPDMAHEIGVKLAKRLWGEKYQVIVATHLDKANHLHSHFVVNTVSWVDGIRYHRTEQDYYNMQIESDKLCREYGLSVIEEPKRGKSKHYGEWKAEQEGKPTYRGMVKADIDQAILESMTERQLWENLHKKGYHIKFGQDITLRPQGKDRGLKLCRNFGEDYSIEKIRKRILANMRPQQITQTQTSTSSTLPSGYYYVSTAYSAWSGWNAWQTAFADKIYNSYHSGDNNHLLRDVQTQWVAEKGHTEWHYYRWTNGSGCYSYKYNNSYWLEEMWFTWELPVYNNGSSGDNVRVNGTGAKNIWIKANDAGNYSTDKTWTRWVVDVYAHTEYQSRTRTATYSYRKDNIEVTTYPSGSGVSNIVEYVQYRPK